MVLEGGKEGREGGEEGRREVEKRTRWRSDRRLQDWPLHLPLQLCLDSLAALGQSKVLFVACKENRKFLLVDGFVCEQVKGQFSHVADILPEVDAIDHNDDSTGSRREGGRGASSLIASLEGRAYQSEPLYFENILSLTLSSPGTSTSSTGFLFWTDQKQLIAFTRLNYITHTHLFRGRLIHYLILLD